MGMSDIIHVGLLWYPPANILYHGNRKLPAETNRQKIKQINETMSAAIMVVGINKITGESYYLQIVDPQEQTPDVRTMRIVKKEGEPNLLEVQEVEVVTLERNSTEEVDDFLKRTKLSGKKSYPRTTIILCHINKNVEKSKSWHDIFESLKDVPVPNDVYVLARTDPRRQKYHLVKVHPVLEFVEYDVMGELFSQPNQRVMKMGRGSDTAIKQTDETYIPFE
jgi:hypothetical protein